MITPPRRRARMAQTSFTSFSPGQRAAVERLARRRRIPQWQIYEEAAAALIEQREAGATIVWEASRGEGGTPHNVRMTAATLEEIRRIAEEQELAVTTVLLTALTRYLQKP